MGEVREENECFPLVGGFLVFSESIVIPCHLTYLSFVIFRSPGWHLTSGKSTRIVLCEVKITGYISQSGSFWIPRGSTRTQSCTVPCVVGEEVMV